MADTRQVERHRLVMSQLLPILYIAGILFLSNFNKVLVCKSFLPLNSLQCTVQYVTFTYLEWSENLASSLDEHIHGVRYCKRVRPVVIRHVPIVLSNCQRKTHQGIAIHTACTNYTVRTSNLVIN